MIDPMLNSRLQPLLSRQRRIEQLRRMAVYWALASLVVASLAVLCRQAGLTSRWLVPVLGFLAVAAAWVLRFRNTRTAPDPGEVARLVELKHPELQGLLLTAVELKPDDNGHLNFLQERVASEAGDHSRRNLWRDAIPSGRLWLARGVHLAAVAFFLAVLWLVERPMNAGAVPARLGLGARAPGSTGVEVTPGDTSIEKGQNLVVLVRFGGKAPGGAELLVTAGDGNERRLPLVRSLADPVFGGSVSDVASNFVYRIE